MRTFLGGLAGIAALLVVMVTLGWVATLGHPVPETARVGAAARAAWLAGAPLSARLALIAGGLLGALTGTLVALRIARSVPAAWIVTAAGALLALPNFLLFSQPWWMQAAVLAAPLIGGWIAMRLAAAPTRIPAEP